MKKIISVSLITALFLSFTAIVSAERPDTKLGKAFSLPAQAVEIAPNVWNLGKKYDKDSDSFVEGYAIIHKKEQAKSAGSKAPRPTICYGFMASGAKWKNTENWSVFPGAGLSQSFLLDNLAGNMNKWENAANYNVFGNGSTAVGIPTDPNILDDNNQVSFGDLDSGTIAVTIVWGNFGGPTFNRRLVAWDQIYSTDFAWSENATGDTTKMDFENIATHELGHAIGLSDIYSSGCSDVTMYGYGTEGETKKRTLEAADILGASTLY